MVHSPSAPWPHKMRTRQADPWGPFWPAHSMTLSGKTLLECGRMWKPVPRSWPPNLPFWLSHHLFTRDLGFRKRKQPLDSRFRSSPHPATGTGLLIQASTGRSHFSEQWRISFCVIQCAQLKKKKILHFLTYCPEKIDLVHPHIRFTVTKGQRRLIF